MSQVKILVHYMSCLSGRANDSSLQTESPCKHGSLQISLQVDLYDGMLRNSTEQNSFACDQAKVNMHCYSPCMCSFTDFRALVAFFKFNQHVKLNFVFSKRSYPTNRHGQACPPDFYTCCRRQMLSMGTVLRSLPPKSTLHALYTMFAG